MEVKCLKCGGTMKKGHLNRGFWIEKRPVLGELAVKIGQWPLKRGIKFIDSYLCEKCGSIELKADIKKN